MNPTTIEAASWIVTTLAVAGVIANNCRLRWCFLLWMASNAATAAIHAHMALWGLLARDAAFFALAIHGYIAWGRPRRPPQTPARPAAAESRSIGTKPGHQPPDQTGPITPAEPPLCLFGPGGDYQQAWPAPQDEAPSRNRSRLGDLDPQQDGCGRCRGSAITPLQGDAG